jgi:hypothetical protein
MSEKARTQEHAPSARALSDAELDAQAAADTDARMLIPAAEIGRWIESWGTPTPLPMPAPRKVR